MPTRKGSKKLNFKHSLLGKFQNNKKVISEMEQKIQKQSKVMQDLQNILTANENTISELHKNIDNQRNKINYKRKRLRALQTHNKLNPNGMETQPGAFLISNIKSKKRLANPTSSGLNQKAKVVRYNETITACNIIHGATPQNPMPAVSGLIGTLTSKVKSKELSSLLLSSKPALVKQLKSTTINEWSKESAKSAENKLRSLKMYYSHNIMGKRKYICLRKANNAVTFKNSKIPNYIPYQELADLINEIDVGTVLDVNTLAENSNENYEGCYRETVEYILRLAEFYITVNKHRSDKLLTLQEQPRKCSNSLLFMLCIGGDGAPASGTAFLVSFINIGKRIASSSENYLLFGANVGEACPIVESYVSKLVNDISHLENNVFDVAGFKVEFSFGELPNDMKMLAYLSGELSNASTYFSSFANVSKQDCNYMDKTFGLTKEHHWQPWEYSKRLQDAAKVSTKKTKTDNRNQITTFIHSNLKSRQEF